MKDNQLNRILKLVGRTGDRFVVLDKETDDAVVIMNLDEYEYLTDVCASNGDLPNCDGKCDCDNCASEEEEVTPTPNFSADDFVPETEPEEIKYESITPAPEKIVSTPIAPVRASVAKKTSAADRIERFGEIAQRYWLNSEAEEAPIAPEDNTKISEEKLDSVPHEDEEEKFYLEPVE